MNVQASMLTATPYAWRFRIRIKPSALCDYLARDV
jgi:hypothetical protein